MASERRVHNHTGEEIIRLGHGGGGRLTHSLVEEVFLPYFMNPLLAPLDDSALLHLSGDKIAFTTDSYVVDPLFFPGGDIGRLAVCGTVNDLAVMGAKPLALSAGFIIEEGLHIAELRALLASMAQAAKEAGVPVVAGDTKVVSAGAADKLFITTAGIGEIIIDPPPSGQSVRVGDAVIVSGTIGDHGMAVMVSREGIEFEAAIKSDVAPLNGLVGTLVEAGVEIHAMRDPTRGGLATTLNEMAHSSAVDIELIERAVPVAEPVRSACELLGFDPFYVANEGKLVLFISEQHASKAVEVLRTHPLGVHAAIIGRVPARSPGRVYLNTEIGGRRILDMLAGEQLPRIC